MGVDTKIEWCHHTFNPWRGCTKVSLGCKHCYAEALSGRNPKLLGKWGPDGTRIIASESYWRQPKIWNRDADRAGERRQVFCASLADVFEDRPELEAPRSRLRWLMFDTVQLDWLLLTKRPEFARQWIDSNLMPRNYWVGVSVEDQQRADERIPILLQTPAPVRFLSVEPLLGPVDFRKWLPSVNWVIIGGESGPYARPCNIAWIRSVVRQCQDASVAVFVKQLGSHLKLKDKKGGDLSEFPLDLQIREFPRS